MKYSAAEILEPEPIPRNALGAFLYIGSYELMNCIKWSVTLVTSGC